MNEITVVLSNENFNENCHDYSKNGSNFDISLNAIAKAGFKNVFIQWYNNDKIWETPQKEQLNKMRINNLNIKFAHLGYQNVNSFWKEGIQGEDEVERYKNDIKGCHNNNINLVVMHLGRNGDNVGLCLDIGHWHCFSKDGFDFTKYKDRIFAVHLHDNNGEEDQHKIPGDGTIDWEKVMSNLKKCNYDRPITLEIIYYTSYYSQGIYEFYKKGYDKGEKLAKFYEECKKEDI